MTDEPTLAVLWQGLLAAAKKENHRDLVHTGPHSVSVHIDGFSDGKHVDACVSVAMLVKPDTERDSSHTPDVDKLLAYVLSLLNDRTRASVVKTVLGLPDGELPDTAGSVLIQAESLLSHLRTTQRQPVKGAVHAEVTVQSVEPKPEETT